MYLKGVDLTRIDSNRNFIFYFKFYLLFCHLIKLRVLWYSMHIMEWAGYTNITMTFDFGLQKTTPSHTDTLPGIFFQCIHIFTQRESKMKPLFWIEMEPISLDFDFHLIPNDSTESKMIEKWTEKRAPLIFFFRCQPLPGNQIETYLSE